MRRVIDIVIQFLKPNGQKRVCRTTVPESVKDNYELMKTNGCRLTAEELQNGMVSVTIEEPQLGDFLIRLVENGPKVQEALEEMLKKFNEKEFEKWKKERS